MLYIGVDIGGTSIKCGFVDEKGNILHRFGFKIVHDEEQEETIRRLGKLILDNISSFGKKKEDFAGIGMGCPGSINSTTGVCCFSNNLHWNNNEVVRIIEEVTSMKAKLSNDANVAMLGEATFGAGKDFNSSILLTLGTGVGGGIYLNGHLYEGNEGKGAEMGHMIIEKDGYPCTCGLKGCLEAYASVTGLIRMSKEEMKRNPKSMMWDFVKGNIDEVDGRTAFECSKKGDESAIKVVELYEDYLTIGLINYSNIFRPDAIILGGGISNQKEYLTSALTKKLASYHYGFKGTPEVKIVVSNLGNDAGILGAAALFF